MTAPSRGCFSIEGFKEFLKVDLQLAPRTVIYRVSYLRKFLAYVNKPLEAISTADIRAYLGSLSSQNVYGHSLKALKLFFREYFKKKELVESFKFPPQDFKPRALPSKEELQRFYAALKSLKDRALFLMLASSGLRRHEILSLHIEDINLDKRMISPRRERNSRTKRAWISFFNGETAEALKEYLASKKDKNPKLFPMSEASRKKIFGEAVEATGLHITPQVLRFWFSNQMADLEVPDRYVDAFCGRTPKTVLARHYSDYSPERLKAIYDKADLKVLT